MHYADEVLRRLMTSRWAKLGLLALTLGFCGYGVFSERASVAAALRHIAWYPVAGSLLAVFAGLACMMLAWRALLADLGSPLPVPAAFRVFFVGQLGKYVPGAVWAAAAQMELARAYQIPRLRSATAAVVSMMVSLATGLLLAAAALPLSSADAARKYWWALALVLPALLSLYPPLISWALGYLLRLLRRPPLAGRISLGGMARAIGWAFAGWACYSVHVWLLVSGVSGGGIKALPLAAGAYALAWSVGFILIPFPGGVGPRELALVAALAPIMATGPAIVVAVLSRLLMTIGDLAWAAASYVVGWATRGRASAQPAAGRPAQPSVQGPVS